MVRKKNRPGPKTKGKRNASPTKTKDSTTDSNIKKKMPSQTTRVLIQHNPNVQYMTKKLYREIRFLQITTRRLIPLMPFQRIVREIMQDFTTGDYRIQTEALRALQEATEMYMTQYFEDAYFCTLHAKRKTLNIADMQCVRRLRGVTDIVNR